MTRQVKIIDFTNPLNIGGITNRIDARNNTGSFRNMTCDFYPHEVIVELDRNVSGSMNHFTFHIPWTNINFIMERDV